MSANGLSKKVGIQHLQVIEYITTHFNRYLESKTYINNTRNQAKQNGYIEILVDYPLVARYQFYK